MHWLACDTGVRIAARMDDEAAAAFARAAALLQRDERLDEGYDSPPKPKKVPGSSSGYGKQPRQPARRRVPTGPADAAIAPVDPNKQLPSLSELSTAPVLDLQRRPPSQPRAGRRAPVPTPEEGRKAALSAMEHAMPSLDEESARLVARARALLDSQGTDAANLGANSSTPLRRSPARRPAGNATRRVATHSAPSSSGDGMTSGRPRRSGDATIPLVDVDASVISQEADEHASEAADDHANYISVSASSPAVAKASALAREAANAAASALAAAASIDAPLQSAFSSGMSTPGAAFFHEDQERPNLIALGAEGAQQRVRQARLADERVKKAEREASEQKRAAAQADAARIAAFQTDVQKRAAMRRREAREASEREKAEVAEEARQREARQQEQARQAEEVRRSLTNAIAVRRAVAKQREEEEQARRDIEAQQARMRSEAHGAQLQAAARARVRERRRQAAQQRGQEEIESELAYLSQAPKKAEAHMRAKEQRTAAAQRLRERRTQDDAGMPEDGFSNEGGDEVEGYGYGGDEQVFDPDDDDDWLGAPQAEAFTNVGFVIRGEEPTVPPKKSTKTVPRVSEATPAPPQGRLRAQASQHAARERRPSEDAQNFAPRARQLTPGVMSVSSEPAQVLEIRSPERRPVLPPTDVYEYSARPVLAPRMDPPPIAPSDLEEAAGPGNEEHSIGALSSISPNSGQAKSRGRRKPWQRAPVPLDRPIDV